jgi:hypothetical protein
MTDLDIQIDVPDDDDLNSPVRVVNGSWFPPWFKAVAVLILGALAAIVIAAFLIGRSRVKDDDLVVPPASPTAPIASAAASPAIDSSLEAVQAWEAFAQTGDLTAVRPFFDPTGPQYALFATAADQRGSDGTGPTPTAATDRLGFSARNLAESKSGNLTTVST